MQIVIRVKILDDKRTHAIITLDFGDFVVKGFRVQQSQFTNFKGDNLWVTPPSYQSGGRYHPMFFVPEKEKWAALEQLIWKAFYAKRIEQHMSMETPVDREESSL